MAKTKQHSKVSKKRAAPEQELDSVYFLKLVMYMIVGAQWLRFTDASGATTVTVPIGLFIGMAFALHDHFRIDRKIEFAVLLVATMVGFYASVGLSVAV
ncbi:MAG: hypothetical protein QFB87_03380 [Patescibacteria group bacterium]|nr:hypothetical protein [Patescibacteria group bacterium]